MLNTGVKTEPSLWNVRVRQEAKGPVTYRSTVHALHEIPRQREKQVDMISTTHSLPLSLSKTALHSHQEGYNCDISIWKSINVDRHSQHDANSALSVRISGRLRYAVNARMAFVIWCCRYRLVRHRSGQSARSGGNC